LTRFIYHESTQFSKHEIYLGLDSIQKIGIDKKSFIS